MLPAPIIPAHSNDHEASRPESDLAEPSLPDPVPPRYLFLHPITLDPRDPPLRNIVIPERSHQETNAFDNLFAEEDELIHLRQEVLQPRPDECFFPEPARRHEPVSIPNQTAPIGPTPAEPAPVEQAPAEPVRSVQVPVVRSAQPDAPRPPVIITATCNYCGALA